MIAAGNFRQTAKILLMKFCSILDAGYQKLALQNHQKLKEFEP